MKPIVGICGKAGAGKSTIAKHLARHYEATVVSFADPLRSMLFPVVDQLFYKEDVENLHAILREHKEQSIEELGTSPRKLLQDIGALMRDHNEDVFIELTKSKIDMLESINNMLCSITGLRSQKTCYIIDDLRYDNEAEWIKREGGMIFGLIRPEEYLRKVPKHHSENGVSRSYIYREFHNDNDMATVKYIAKEIAELCGISPEKPEPIIDPRGSRNVH